MKIVHLTFKLETETFPVDFGNISLFSFYIVVELIYNVMLVSSVQQMIQLYIHSLYILYIYTFSYTYPFFFRSFL